jgi:spore cortex formation protein SpoVR/YcgB (stage V sporulation)
MNTNQEYLTTLHAEHNEWIKDLEFYKDEIASFENRLGEVALKNTHDSVLAPLEHLQNQFIREKEVIDILRHDIKADRKKLTHMVESNNVATDHRKTDDHSDLRERMDTFLKIYGDLKHEVTHFLAEVL